MTNSLFLSAQWLEWLNRHDVHLDQDVQALFDHWCRQLGMMPSDVTEIFEQEELVAQRTDREKRQKFDDRKTRERESRQLMLLAARPKKGGEIVTRKELYPYGSQMVPGTTSVMVPEEGSMEPLREPEPYLPESSGLVPVPEQHHSGATS